MSPEIESTYEIIREIGAGGGGVVYLARHKRLEKWVVLKADKRPLTTDAEKLRREVDMLKNLSQTYIPQVYDFIIDEEAGTAYTIMDYIEGKDLNSLQKNGEKFSQPLVIKWARQLLEALSYLHNHKENGKPHCILHGDIKPANIMLTPQDDIRLIDFNIALDMGDENAVWVKGVSRGYASPEQLYAFTSGSMLRGDTEIIDSETGQSYTRSAVDGGRIMDVRSDIYSLGATLYRLLSGRRPAPHAKDVTPLSSQDASPAVAAIINKAMSPNPDDRYQTADEMLRAFKNLYPNDPRMKRHKFFVAMNIMLSSLLLLSGAVLTFIGQEQMKRAENARVLAEYSADALQNGDVDQAIIYALDALPEERGILDPPDYIPQAQRALTNALGVYDFADGYKSYRAIALPGQPVKAGLSPKADAAVTLVQNQENWEFSVFNLESGDCTAKLPAAQSALSDFIFRDENILFYAGINGLTAYDLDANQELWSTGVPATTIALSADGSTVATVFRDQTEAYIWDAVTGESRRVISFGERHLKVLTHDVLFDPEDNLFALNETGVWLAVSFSDGALTLFNTLHENWLELYENSNYTHFEGGFHGKYFAFCANGPESSLFDVIDVDEAIEIGGFSMTTPFHIHAQSDGVYLSSQNVLVQIDPSNGEQQEAAYTRADIASFYHTPERMIVITQDRECLIYDAAANLIQQLDREVRTDFAAVAGLYILTANHDAPVLQIYRWEQHDDAQTLSYDPKFIHSEAHISLTQSSAMLYNYQQFRITGKNQEIIFDFSIPDEMEVYSQRYLRDDGEERLEIKWNNGVKRTYSANTGLLLSEEQEEPPDDSMYEEYVTGDFLIKSPLHGDPEIYDRASGELIAVLHEDAYLAFVTQTGEYLIAEFFTADTDNNRIQRYGLLLNRKCETLADLPNLCDILPDGTLIFDDNHGNLRQSRVYSIEELIQTAKTQRR